MARPEKPTNFYEILEYILIITNEFVLMHMHKSGGTFANKVILSTIPDAKRFGYHLPYRYLPNELKNSLTPYGLIRNPWDFYVSLYYFQSQSRSPNYIYCTFSNDNTLSQQETIAAMARPTEDHFDRMFDQAPTNFNNNGVNLTKSCVDELSSHSGGWYQRMFKRLHLGCEPIVLKQENLRNELIEKIGKRHLGDKLDQFKQYTLELPKLNTSNHQHYSTYYDEKTRNIIAKSDSDIIDRFGYKFNCKHTKSV